MTGSDSWSSAVILARTIMSEPICHIGRARASTFGSHRPDPHEALIQPCMTPRGHRLHSILLPEMPERLREVSSRRLLDSILILTMSVFRGEGRSQMRSRIRTRRSALETGPRRSSIQGRSSRSPRLLVSLSQAGSYTKSRL